MNQYKTDIRTGLQYELQGDCYVIAGEEDKWPAVGIWGQRHLRWLKQNRRVTYTNLFTSGKLYGYLQEIDAQVNEQLDALITQMAKAERVDITRVQRLEGPSALCHVTMREGDRVLGDYDEGVMECFALRKEDLAYLSGFDLVITGLWGRTEKYLEQIRASGTLIAFDGADRPFDPAGLTALPHTDLAFFSDDSMDDEALREKISSAASLGPRIVVATRGAKGSLAFDGTAFYDCPPAPCTVVDTMGAGDSYIAGFIKTWLEGKSIAECMETGALTAAGTIARQGAW